MNRFNLVIMLSIFSHSVFGGIPGITQLNSSQFHKIIGQKNITLLDVRTNYEYSNGHIENAGQLNYYSLDFKKKLLLLPKDQPLYLYCNTGYRSHKAAEILAINGYKQIYNLQNGIMEWEIQDLPIIIEPDAKPDIRDKMEPDEFTSFIKTHSITFVDFYAPWCGPCRKMMPLIDSLQNQYTAEISIIKVNVDASKKLVKELQIGGVPYFVLYKNGEIVFTHSGLLTREKLVELFVIHNSQ